MASSDTEINEEWSLRFLDGKPLHWNPKNPEEAKAGVRHFAKIAWAHRKRVKSVAVSCNGPFLSLDPGDQQSDPDVYGTLDPETCHLPFRGLSIPKLFNEVFDRDWMERDETRFNVYHDSNASALGEAVARGTGMNDIVAHLSVTEGVGLGMVRGRRFVETAHHPEIGLMPVQPRATDPLSEKRKLPLYTLSLAEFTDNKSLVKRYELEEGKPNPSLLDITNHLKKEFWDMRAFYLAQACLACLVVHPPKKIIIGAQIDPLGNIAERTTYFFRRIMEIRKENKQPIPNYPALANDYSELIELPKPMPGLDAPHNLATTGAAGMCYAAADALSRNNVVRPNERS